MKTLIRRMVASGGPVASLAKLLVRFSTADCLEGVHPLQSGLFRCKHRSERRPGLPRESAVIFWARYLWQLVATQVRLAGTIVRLAVSTILIVRSNGAKAYTDLALTPVQDGEDETLELLTQTTGAREAIAHVKKVAALTHAAPAG
jgi:hypothetical protein